jgi:VanZ family protein
VSDPQSWRNPSRAPTASPEARSQLRKPSIPTWLLAWWPALLWAAVIFTMSTDAFSAQHTAGIIEPVIHWFVPSLSEDQVDLIHYVIRKTAHFTEYFVFGLLLYRAIRGSHQSGWRWSRGLAAWFIAAGYSALDEIHQAFVASRTASPYDSLLDSIGAFVAVVVLYVIFRFRQPRQPEAPAVPAPS